MASYALATTAYQLGLMAVAHLPARVLRGTQDAVPTFDILIPAHNEADTLPLLLHSIAALAYPNERVRVHVVADNCTDATATVARAAGATVYEREDAIKVGKGHALELGIDRILASPGQPADAVVVVDADSVLDPGFLAAAAVPLAAGADAVQGYYSVTNAADSSVAALRFVALCLYHYARPRGRARLGLSVGLRGNGMCFTRRLLTRTGWRSHGLTEDIEQHFQLLDAGYHVAFAPAAVVSAEMPISFDQATAQNRRWERGRMQSLLHDVPRFIGLAIRRRDPSALDAALEQAVAPLSVCLGTSLLTALLGAVARSRRLTLCGIAGLVGQIVYVLAGLRLAGAPPAAYRALLTAPRYIAWKVALWAGAVVRPPTHWTRTKRLAEAHQVPVGARG